MLESKDFSSAQLAELNHLKLKNANAKYLRIKGNLNVRGLIEEYEQSEMFKQYRKKLTVKVTVTDEASSKRTGAEQESALGRSTERWKAFGTIGLH